MGYDIAQLETIYANENLNWLGSAHGTQEAESATLDDALFPVGTWADRIVKSGTVIGKVTATGKFGPYDNAAVDGRQTAVGHLLSTSDVSKGDVVAPYIWHGQVVEAKLPANHGLNAAAKAELIQMNYV